MVSPQCEYECVYSECRCKFSEQLLANGHHMFHICMVSLQCEFEYVFSDHDYYQTELHMFHICTVYHQCECECVSSDKLYVQNQHRMFHMYKVYFKCAYECVCSVKNSVQTVHRMFRIYKVPPSVGTNMSLQVCNLSKLGITCFTWSEYEYVFPDHNYKQTVPTFHI